MIKAVIFDFDGVIADSEKLHYQALNAVFNMHDVDVPWSLHYEKYLGYTDQENIEAVNRDYKMGLNDRQIQDMMVEKMNIFLEMAKTNTCIIDGVGSFIKMLDDNQIRRAICSGALRADIDLMLEGAVFANGFETVVTADDVTKGKPDPEGYLIALNRLNENTDGDGLVDPGECIVIEDSHWGLQAASAAGMIPVAVTNTYPKKELENKAEMIVNRLDELTIDALRGLRH